MKKITLYISIFVLVTLSLSACKTRVVQPDIPVIIFDKDTAIVENVFIDTIVIDTLIVDTVVTPINIKKDNYRVAMILPFMEDSVRNAWNNSKAKNFQNFKSTFESEVSASFFEGFLLALKEVQLDSKFDIKVFDNQNNTLKTKAIVSKLEKDSFDIIVGPYAKKNVMEVSRFAAEKEIIHISPFTPSKSASFGNPKYLMMEPSLEQHILSMVNYALDTIEDPHFKFLYPDTQSGESYAQFLNSYFDSLNIDRSMDKKIKYALIQLKQSGFNLSDKLDQGPENVIILNSFNEDFLHVFLRQLEQLNNNYKFTIFGMPGWEESPIVRLEYLNSTSTHFTKSVWVDQESSNIEFFNEKYKTKYEKKPNNFAYLGYDVAAVMFKVIDDYGITFPEHLDGFQINGLSRNYVFKKVLTSEQKVHRIENTFLHIYKIEEFEQILLR